MKKYKITLWRNDDFCEKYGSEEECTFTKQVEAESRYFAAYQAVSPHVNPRRFRDKPSVYEIVEMV